MLVAFLLLLSQLPSLSLSLRGNFLHITDIHVDPHYLPGATVKSSCHRTDQSSLKIDTNHNEWNRVNPAAVLASAKHGSDDDDEDVKDKKKADKKKKKKDVNGVAGRWGAPVTRCDTSVDFLKVTMDQLQRDWSDKVDLILYTGDSARHDTDHHIPRTLDEVLSLNRQVAQSLITTFPGIPIIPNIGNNDVYPHNIVEAGPNPILNSFLDTWSNFIPESQYHTVQLGGYFVAQFGRLKIISLNTLYFFNLNTAVSGCQKDDDPGTIQLQWMRERLKEAKDDESLVIIMGHVPPSLKMYHSACWLGYVTAVMEVAELVHGQYFGHANVDHFFAITQTDVQQVQNMPDNEVNGKVNVEKMNKDEGDGEEEENDDDEPDDHEITDEGKGGGMGHAKYLQYLLDSYQHLPGPSSPDANTTLVVHVAPSVIPTYYPAYRIVQHQEYVPMGYTQFYCNLTRFNEAYENGNTTTMPLFEVEYDTKNDLGLEGMQVWDWLAYGRKLVSGKKKGEKMQQEWMQRFYVSTRM